MTSTFFGLLLGIAAAAYLATHYSDSWNHWVQELAPVVERTLEPPASASETRTGVLPAAEVLAAARSESTPKPKPKPEPEPEQEAETPAIAEPVASIPVAEVAPERPATVAEEHGDELEQRWAEFAAQAHELKAVGTYRWRDCFTRAAAAHGVSEPLLLAIASGESDFEPAARSDKDAIGLMQIRWPITSHHLGVLREADLYDPCTNVDAGARYLAELSERFDHNLHRAVAAYNYGPTRIEGAAMPAGARWYSQYIYQHLLKVLDRPHVATSELVPPVAPYDPGFEVLIRFNQSYRARDYKSFLESQLPGLELAHRSELPGLHEVVLLYRDQSERNRALQAIQASGLLPRAGDRSISL